MNNPINNSYEYNNGVKAIRYDYFFNTYIVKKHIYESNGQHWNRTYNYLNRIVTERIDYVGNGDYSYIAKHTYESTGKYWAHSIYYEDSIRRKEVFYSGEENNIKIRTILYDTDGVTVISITEH